MFGIIAKLELDKSSLLDQVAEIDAEFSNGVIKIAELEQTGQSLSKRKIEILEFVLEYDTAINALLEREDTLSEINKQELARSQEQVALARKKFLDQWPTAQEPELLNEQNSTP